jgi:hypothetical protein
MIILGKRSVERVSHEVSPVRMVHRFCGFIVGKNSAIDEPILTGQISYVKSANIIFCTTASKPIKSDLMGYQSYPNQFG